MILTRAISSIKKTMYVWRLRLLRQLTSLRLWAAIWILRDDLVHSPSFAKGQRNRTHQMDLQTKNLIKEYKSRINKLEGEKQRLKRQAYPTGPMHISKGMKDLVMFEGMHMCYYCGGIANTLDHLHPLSLGGTNVRSNLVACCAPCNTLKGDMTVSEFMELRRLRNLEQ